MLIIGFEPRTFGVIYNCSPNYTYGTPQLAISSVRSRVRKYCEITFYDKLFLELKTIKIIKAH